MTEQAPDAAAWQYVRDELANLRSSVQGELGAMRSEFAELSRELRGHLLEQGPRIAVIERRLDEHDKDLAAAGEDKRDNRALWAAIVIAVLAWVPDAFALLGKR